jgi:hypothetical protein
LSSAIPSSSALEEREPTVVDARYRLEAYANSLSGLPREILKNLPAESASRTFPGLDPELNPGLNGAKLGRIWGDLLSRRDGAIVAWHEVPGERVPSKDPSRRVRYDRAPRIPEIFLVEMCAVFLTKGEILFLKGSCPMMFELLLDGMDRFLNLRESVPTLARITPYPTGRLFWVGLAQALRARLRSHRPSGTFATGFSHIQNRVEHHRLRSFQQ